MRVIKKVVIVGFAVTKNIKPGNNLPPSVVEWDSKMAQKPWEQHLPKQQVHSILIHKALGNVPYNALRSFYGSLMIRQVISIDSLRRELSTVLPHGVNIGDIVDLYTPVLVEFVPRTVAGQKALDTYRSMLA